MRPSITILSTCLKMLKLVIDSTLGMKSKKSTGINSTKFTFKSLSHKRPMKVSLKTWYMSIKLDQSIKSRCSIEEET